MKRIFYLSAIAIASLIAFSSCKDDETEDYDDGAQIVNFTLNIAPYMVDGVSTNDVRTQLNNVWLLAFDSDGNCVDTRRVFGDVTMGESVSSRMFRGTNMKVVAVTNLLATFTPGRFTYDDLQNSMSYGFMTLNKRPVVNDIPMIGEIDGVTVPEADGTHIGTITVSRIAAEVRFKVTTSTPGYEIKTYALNNMPMAAYYFSQGEKTTWPVDDFMNMQPVEAVTGEVILAVAENLSGTVSGITSPKDKVTTRLAVCLEVVAEKEGAEATFRYFFGDNDTTDFNVARNRAYTLDMDIDFDDATDNRITR